MMMPETLPLEKRATDFSFSSALSSINPFNFLQIYRSPKSTKTLKQLTTITTLQTALEGKCMSDMHQIWARNHLSENTSNLLLNLISGVDSVSAFSVQCLTLRPDGYSSSAFSSISTPLCSTCILHCPPLPSIALYSPPFLSMFTPFARFHSDFP